VGGSWLAWAGLKLAGLGWLEVHAVVGGSVTVCVLGGCMRVLFTGRHELQAFGPARDDAAEGKLNRLSARNGRVKHRAVHKPLLVVHLVSHSRRRQKKYCVEKRPRESGWVGGEEWARGVAGCVRVLTFTVSEALGLAPLPAVVDKNTSPVAVVTAPWTLAAASSATWPAASATAALASIFAW
jgi:hypothetical protein